MGNKTAREKMMAMLIEREQQLRVWLYDLQARELVAYRFIESENVGDIDRAEMQQLWDQHMYEMYNSADEREMYWQYVGAIDEVKVLQNAVNDCFPTVEVAKERLLSDDKTVRESGIKMMAALAGSVEADV